MKGRKDFVKFLKIWSIEIFKLWNFTGAWNFAVEKVSGLPAVQFRQNQPVFMPLLNKHSLWLQIYASVTFHFSIENISAFENWFSIGFSRNGKQDL